MMDGIPLFSLFRSSSLNQSFQTKILLFVVVSHSYPFRCHSSFGFSESFDPNPTFQEYAKDPVLFYET